MKKEEKELRINARKEKLKHFKMQSIADIFPEYSSSCIEDSTSIHEEQENYAHTQENKDK